jgi:molecular chaperone GrpE (heat shock protein)
MNRIDTDDATGAGPGTGKPVLRELAERPVLAMSVREWMVQRFALWLDESFSDEPAPGGLAAEILARMRRDEADADPAASDPPSPPDMLRVVSSMTALVQEVKLQGRSFSELTRSLAPLSDLEARFEESGRAHDEALAVARRLAEESRDARGAAADQAIARARRDGQRKILDLLLDVRDRLGRGLATARSVARAAGAGAGAGAAEASAGPRAPGATTPAPPVAPAATSLRGWIARLFSRGDMRARRLEEALESLQNGYRIGVERLDDALADLGVREVDCRDREFDPRAMAAIEVADAGPGTPDGRVLEVLRAGYTWGAEVLRPAHVRVARASPALPARPERSSKMDLDEGVKR